MKHAHSDLWSSISILIGAVIAVLALVRGKWEIPLLLAVFALWGLWVVVRLLIPAWRLNRGYRRRVLLRRKERRELAASGTTKQELAHTLLRHVNYRVSAALRSTFPDAHWEWTMDDPALFAAQGGTGRIRVYGIPDYDYADVTIDQNANLSCTLLKLAPVIGGKSPSALPPNQQQVSPQTWYEQSAKDTLEQIVADLNSKGHSRLYLKEDGEISIRPVAGGEDVPQSRLRDFPAKVYWPKLVEVLKNAGLTATQLDDCIQLSW